MMAGMGAVEFAKGHGTGNDFVIVPDPHGRLDLTPRLVAALCDRRFGVGGDGVLRVVRTAALDRPPALDPPPLDPPAPQVPSGAADWFMDYRNADGSVAEMCGNGVRVFARYLRARGWAPAEVSIGTRSGPVLALVTDEAVSVTMGPARVGGRSAARVGDRLLAGLAVDCGNPHLVCELPPDLDLAGVDLTGPPEIDRAVFPSGVNVELVAPAPQVEDGGPDLRMRVYERGVGETLSCGSGAVAAAAATLYARGRPAGVLVLDLPGGRLTVSVTDGEAALTGPAVLVAQGTIDLEALPAPDRATRH
jgi:diaminopimelate epimerase